MSVQVRDDAARVRNDLDVDRLTGELADRFTNISADRIADRVRAEFGRWSTVPGTGLRTDLCRASHPQEAASRGRLRGGALGSATSSTTKYAVAGVAYLYLCPMHGPLGSSKIGTFGRALERQCPICNSDAEVWVGTRVLADQDESFVRRAV